MIDATLTMIDSGLFTELAIRLAREFELVRSHVPWAAEFPTLNDRWVGRGLPHVEWVEDPYRRDIRDSTDLFCFPDILRAGEQEMLEDLGFPVWGSRNGDELETNRLWFRELQEELGMPVPDYEVLKGYDALVDFLKDHGHCFVKATSKIRGSMETHEFWDFEQDAYWLDALKVKLGCAAEYVVFLVEEPVESPYETGIDTYCVNGQFPKTPMQGIEVKGKLILSSAQLKSRTPKPFDDALTNLAPILRERGYCNFLSAEFRQDILIDFCARAPNPGIGVEMEMISNLGEIIYQGAQGNLIEPDFEFEYGIQAAIFHEHDKELAKQFRIPDDLRRWVKLMEFAKVGELYQIIPRPPHGEKIGWLLGVGHSIEEATEHLQSNAEELSQYPFDIKLDALPEAVAQAQAMEAEGLDFADQPIPEPEEVNAEL